MNTTRRFLMTAAAFCTVLSVFGLTGCSKRVDEKTAQYNQLRQKLETNVDALVNKLNDAEGTKLQAKVQESVTDLAKLETEYRDAKAKGADATTLDQLTEKYVAGVETLSKAVSGCAARVDAEAQSMTETLSELVVTFQDRAEKDQAEISKTLERVAKASKPINDAVDQIEPFARNVQEADVKLLVESGGKLTDELKKEALRLGAKTTLENKAK